MITLQAELECTKIPAKLPEGILLFTSDGCCIFPVYGPEDRKPLTHHSYLITRPKERGGLGGDKYYNQTVDHGLSVDPNKVVQAVLDAVPVFLANLKELL